jgi:hypothetical protein
VPRLLDLVEDDRGQVAVRERLVGVDSIPSDV